MAYQTPITIKDAILNIQKGKYVLPAIQREFVWKTEQIEKLFDSLMRDYPISTFLFWNVEKGQVSKFQFYNFLKKYHERKQRHNTKVDLTGDEDVVAILDGQQRLTSLYLSLRGSFAEKLPYYRWDSEHAFPEKKLYLDLLAPAKSQEMMYDFQFLTSQESQQKIYTEFDEYLNIEIEKKVFWFEVGKIIEFKDLPTVMKYLMDEGLTNTANFSLEQTSFALNTLTELYNVIHQKGTISFYQETSPSLDKVLQIFIRINAGGTKLSYSDLLLSIATAEWKERDARDVIHSFVDEINGIGTGFGFNKDFVMKACLVLADFTDVKFKVDNFTKENMLKIERQWEDISSALKNAVHLIDKFGFNRTNLTSANAVIPIAYYFFKNQLDEKVISSVRFESDRQQIREWLIRSLLKRVFGSAADNIYSPLRKVIGKHLGGFPLQQIKDELHGTSKSITFSEEDIDNFVELDYHDPLAFSVLSLIYKGINLNLRYHLDHIHPKSMFTDAKLKRERIDSEHFGEYQWRFNLLPNLQLLQKTENEEKSKKPLAGWVESQFEDEKSKTRYLDSHFFPADISLEFSDFISFYESRKGILRKKLKEAVGA